MHLPLQDKVTYLEYEGMSKKCRYSNKLFFRLRLQKLAVKNTQPEIVPVHSSYLLSSLLLSLTVSHFSHCKYFYVP